MEKYEKYKDSGVEWIGKIPNNWGVTKLKFHTNKIIDGAHFTPTYIDNVNGVPFLRVSDIHEVNIDLDTVKRIPLEEHKELSKRCNPKKGDLLLSKNGTIGLMKIIDWDWEFSIFVSLCLIKFEESLTNSFFYYFFQSNIVERQIFESSQKTSVTNLHLEKIKELRLTLPSLMEQTAIANYLDKKTTELDTLISKKENLIELLKEERTAIINQAVTKGLDPDVEMKDSGVEWLGEIPAHWGVKKLKYIFDSKNTIRVPLNAEERGNMENKIYDYYGASGVIDFVDNYLFDEETILIGEDGANLLTRSKRLAFIAKGKYWVNNHAHILKPKNGNIEYLCELLELIDYTEYVSGSAQPKLTQEALMSINIFEPPIEEQNLIFKFLKTEFNRIDTIISKAEQEITLLEEYKTALISEVVTGKVKVV
ncbi:restriction endonuclease subunit S [Dyadobacter sp. 3J3]|uniref:restriction endonuclease subunit S n=1 Tax=Dyadobacter sp. 3J3 TaxID=2606600 RepID=UPI001358A4A1|nr:restriction endonuclease subunit S [Dyadobacter sp. 3J3]